MQGRTGREGSEEKQGQDEEEEEKRRQEAELKVGERRLLQPLAEADRVTKQILVSQQHLVISQHERPPSLQKPPAVNRFGYSTATSIEDVKEIRHSRRHLAINGRPERHGMRGSTLASIPHSERPITSEQLEQNQASKLKSIAQREHPIASEQLEKNPAGRNLDRQSPGSPLDPNKDAEHDHYSSKKRVPLPPSGLMTFLGRLSKLGEPSMRLPAQPRSNVRGAIKRPRKPRWKEMMGHHRLKTPLAFPTTASEREEFDRQLDLWKVYNSKRWQAHEAQTRHTSFPS